MAALEMKILQVIDFMPETSGGARFVVNLAKSLKSKNIDVDVLLIDGKKSHFIDELHCAGINTIHISSNINRFNLFYAFKVSKYLDKYDVIHVHIFPSSYQVALARIFNNKSAPIVFTEHSSYNRRASNFLFRYIESFMYRRFSVIICLSSQVLSFLDKNLNIPKENYRIIENAVNTNLIFNCEIASRENLGLSDNDFLVMMSARLDRPKRQDLLINALRLLPTPIKVIFLGNGKNMSYLKELVLNNNLSERVLFLGARSDVFNLMKMVNVNVLASDYEGLSLAALEAMSTGKPFIASDVDGLNFVINNSQYVFKNDIESLRNLILRLYQDQKFYKEASQYVFKRSKDFDINIMTHKYIDVYNSQIAKELK